MPLPIDTPLGIFTGRYSAKGLARLDFPSAPTTPRETGPPSAQVRRWHALTTRAVQDVLAGRAPGGLPPLDLSVGTDFQQRVWQALCRLGPGETRSYSQIAAAIGNPGAARAVGAACGANPIPLLVPCHRVLAANHRLGGFSAGLNWKRVLLEREGVRPEAAARLVDNWLRQTPLTPALSSRGGDGARRAGEGDARTAVVRPASQMEFSDRAGVVT